MTGLVACDKTKTQKIADLDAKSITYAYSEMSLSGIKGEPEKIMKWNGTIYVLAVEWDEEAPISRVYQLDDGYKKAELVTELNTEKGKVSVGEIITIGKNTITYWTFNVSEKKKEIIVADWMGNIQNRLDVSDHFQEDAMVNHVCQSEKGNYAIYSETQVIIVDDQGKKITNADAQTGICGCAISNEGKVIVAVNEKEGVMAYELNERDGSLSSKMLMDTNSLSGASDNALCDGDDNYNFYLRGQSRLYGYDQTKMESIPLLDYTASTMETTEAFSIIPITQQQMMSICYNESQGAILSSYRKVDPDKLQDKQKITIGGLYINGDSTLVNQVAAFNKSNPEYEMEIRNYSSENAVEQFNVDVVSGNIPDILVLNEESPIEEYIEKGMLENLSDYLDQDEELNKEDMLDSLREAMEVEGKLYYLSDEFEISTWVVPTDYVGNKIGWTMEEYMEFVKQYPDAALFDFTEKSQVLYALTFNNMVDFVDWEQGKCNFDSEEFIDMLKLANERGTNEEMDDADRLEAYHNREILFEVSNWDDIYMIQSAKRTYGVDNVTMIGRPNREKNGSAFVFQRVYGISTGSKMKEAAWKFVREILTGHVLVRKDAFQEYIDGYRDSIGEHEYKENADGTYEYASPTEEEIQQYIDLINRTNKVEWKDNNIYRIVEEEAKTCFAGQRNEEETARIIQNRVTTYMNEKK